ncbi:MAG: FtsB family cell division protein [Geminicoccales bacterium]
MPFLGMAALAYIAFHAVQGERGLVAWWRVSAEIEQRTAQVAAISAEVARLERRVALMRPDNLDRDMLDEQVREALLLADPHELIIQLGR